MARKKQHSEDEASARLARVSAARAEAEASSSEGGLEAHDHAAHIFLAMLDAALDGDDE